MRCGSRPTFRVQLLISIFLFFLVFFFKNGCETNSFHAVRFLNGNEFFDEDDPKILDDFVDQLNADSKSTNFTVPGTVSEFLI